MIRVTREDGVFCPSCGKRDVPGIRIEIGLTDDHRSKPFSSAVTRLCEPCVEALTITTGKLTMPELFDGWLEPL